MYDRRHTVVQWGGTLPGGEIWSNSLRFTSHETGSDAGVPDGPQLDGYVAGHLKDALVAFFQRTTSRIADGTHLTFVKANVVGMDGRYVDANTHEYRLPIPQSGNISGAYMPNQATVVASLTTGLQRGLAHRGRIYLPGPALILDKTTGRMSTTDAGGIATSVKDLIVAMADTPGIDATGPFRAMVMSNVGVGATHVITGVSVGRVLDTQRRRRVEQLEDYQSVVVDQGAD